MNTNFTLSDDQQETLTAWYKDRLVEGVKKQKEDMPNPPPHVKECWEAGFPYGGAPDGALTYHFTPTSIGVGLTVTDAHTDSKIDLTEYDKW